MKNIKNTILITGINGFLGSSLAKKLSESFCIIGLEKTNSDSRRLVGYKFKIYHSSNPLNTIFEDQQIDYIIHTATLFGRDNELVSELITSNLFFPIKLIETAKVYGVKAFINTHTSLPRNTSDYSLSKGQFLDWLQIFQKDIQIVNLVPEHFYGPEAGDSNFVTSIIKKMMSNVPSIDLTLGEQRRDFVHIDDLVEAYCMILKNINSLPMYSKFEVGSCEIHSIKDVVLKVHQLTQSITMLNFGAIPYRDNELMQSKSNCSNIKELGWTPNIKLESGISSVIEYFKNKL